MKTLFRVKKNGEEDFGADEDIVRRDHGGQAALSLPSSSVPDGVPAEFY